MTPDQFHLQWWAVTDEDGKTHIKEFHSHSAAVKWCTRDLGLSCRGCRSAKFSEIANQRSKEKQQ